MVALVSDFLVPGAFLVVQWSSLGLYYGNWLSWILDSIDGTHFSCTVGKAVATMMPDFHDLDSYCFPKSLCMW